MKSMNTTELSKGMNDRMDIIVKLIQNGANVDAKMCGMTPLFWAVMVDISFGSTRLTTLLLEEKANVNAQCTFVNEIGLPPSMEEQFALVDQATPLSFCLNMYSEVLSKNLLPVESSMIALIQTLLTHKADLYLKDASGFSIKEFYLDHEFKAFKHSLAEQDLDKNDVDEALNVMKKIRQTMRKAIDGLNADCDRFIHASLSLALGDPIENRPVLPTDLTDKIMHYAITPAYKSAQKLGENRKDLYSSVNKENEGKDRPKYFY
jgi:hypothetical protein